MPPTPLRSNGPACLRIPPPDLLKLQLSKSLRRRGSEVLAGLPLLTGSPIRVSTRPRLIAYRGRLVSGRSFGSAVYAASFLRERKIVLESTLLSDYSALRFILIHELFHFVWPRLGNGSRQSFEAILVKESQHGARGELGESSGVKKESLRRHAGPAAPRLWHEYVCECFCDTAAWLYARSEREDRFPLAKRWKEGRQRWFDAAAKHSWKC